MAVYWRPVSTESLDNLPENAELVRGGAAASVDNSRTETPGVLTLQGKTCICGNSINYLRTLGSPFVNQCLIVAKLYCAWRRLLDLKQWRQLWTRLALSTKGSDSLLRIFFQVKWAVLARMESAQIPCGLLKGRVKSWICLFLWLLRVSGEMCLSLGWLVWLYPAQEKPWAVPINVETDNGHNITFYINHSSWSYGWDVSHYYYSWWHPRQNLVLRFLESFGCLENMWTKPVFDCCSQKFRSSNTLGGIAAVGGAVGPRDSNRVQMGPWAQAGHGWRPLAQNPPSTKSSLPKPEYPSTAWINKLILWLKLMGLCYLDYLIFFPLRKMRRDLLRCCRKVF